MANTNARKTRAKKPATNKPATRKSTTRRKPTPAAAKSKTPEGVRNVFLAGLGCYGKALEEAQNQIRENREKIEQRREKAGEIFGELVKRGEKVELDTRKKLKKLELPDLLPELKIPERIPAPEELRDDLRNRLDHARDSFDALRKAISAKPGSA